MLRKWWTSLTRCAEEGCDRPPERLGYCDRHARPYHPHDEFWADDEPDESPEPDERTDLPPAAVSER